MCPVGTRPYGYDAQPSWPQRPLAGILSPRTSWCTQEEHLLLTQAPVHSDRVCMCGVCPRVWEQSQSSWNPRLWLYLSPVQELRGHSPQSRWGQAVLFHLYLKPTSNKKLFCLSINWVLKVGFPVLQTELYSLYKRLCSSNGLQTAHPSNQETVFKMLCDSNSCRPCSDKTSSLNPLNKRSLQTAHLAIVMSATKLDIRVTMWLLQKRNTGVMQNTFIISSFLDYEK